MVIAHALGARIKRREDPRLITGTATYVDDVQLPGLLHVVLVRSPHAHAKITGIEAQRARAAPGVVAVWTGEDVRARCGPLPIGSRLKDMKVPKRYPLVIDGVVRHVGDPVAAVVATHLPLARDASELVEVTYEPLPAVTDVEAALTPQAPLIHLELGTNVCFRLTFGGSVDDAFAHADRTLSLRIVQQRLVPSAMETRGVVAQFRDRKSTRLNSSHHS